MSATSLAEGRLTERGISKGDARALVRAMRRDVARMSGYLLPEVVYSTAPGLFLGVQRVLAGVLEEAVSEMMSRGSAAPRPGMVRYSVVPGIVLDPVATGWVDRASRRGLGHTITTRPKPDYALRRYREACEEGIAEGTPSLQAVPPQFRGRVGALLYYGMAKGIAGEEERVRQVEWTGWALLAVMMALGTHDDKVPFPDWRGGDDLDAMYAKEAFHKGQALLIAGGLELINEAEREAGNGAE
jgi:hypothetical protein